MTIATKPAVESEVSILTRIFNNQEGGLPEEVARYVLTLKFSDRDKDRMHDLIVRNQEGTLTPAEKEEMHAYGRVGDWLSILQSKARQRLGIKLDMTPR